MSNRYKFRAWNNELKGYGYFNLGGKPRWDSVTKGNKTYHYSGLDCADTVEQCTGLKDRNGVLIFEGDIVDLHGDGLAVMFWYNRFLMVHEPSCGEEREGECMTDEFQSSYSQNNVKIIGNIHEETTNE